MFSSFLQTSVPPQADRILLLKLQKDTPKGNKNPKSFSFQKPREMVLFLSAGPVSQEPLKLWFGFQGPSATTVNTIPRPCPVISIQDMSTPLYTVTLINFWFFFFLQHLLFD